jgi:hypothetical protein
MMKSNSSYSFQINDVARPEGLEPPTLCLEGRRSIRLSYGRADYQSHSKPLLDFVSRNLTWLRHTCANTSKTP